MRRDRGGIASRAPGNRQAGKASEGCEQTPGWMACWHETDSDLSRLSLAMLVRDRLRPGDRVTGSPYVTFLAKQLPAQDWCYAGGARIAARDRPKSCGNRFLLTRVHPRRVTGSVGGLPLWVATWQGHGPPGRWR